MLWKIVTGKRKEEPSHLDTEKVVLEVERRQWAKGLHN